jgi:hypothetical protein
MKRCNWHERSPASAAIFSTISVEEDAAHGLNGEHTTFAATFALIPNPSPQGKERQRESPLP